MYLASFIAQNLKKIVRVDPEFMRTYHFRAQNDPFVLSKKILVHTIIITFLEKIIHITFIYLLAPFIVQYFKKILLTDAELSGCTIFGPKMVHFPKWEFFQKTR